MSENNTENGRVAEVTEELMEDVQTTANAQRQQPKQQQQVQLGELQVGYVVGLTTTGEPIFEVVGQQKELLNVIGLNAFATTRINSLLQKAAGTSDLAEVAGALKVLNSKLDLMIANKE